MSINRFRCKYEDKDKHKCGADITKTAVIKHLNVNTSIKFNIYMYTNMIMNVNTNVNISINNAKGYKPSQKY